MPGLIYYDELKRAMGLPEGARQSTVEKALRKRKVPFGFGENGLYTTLDAVNASIMGLGYGQPEDQDAIEFVDVAPRQRQKAK